MCTVHMYKYCRYLGFTIINHSAANVGDICFQSHIDVGDIFWGQNMYPLLLQVNLHEFSLVNISTLRPVIIGHSSKNLILLDLSLLII
jgi:hypothetical protein